MAQTPQAKKSIRSPQERSLNQAGLSTAEIQRYFIGLNDEDANAIESNSKSLWVYGYVAFSDLLGTRHESRFCARWRPASDLGNSPMGFVYSSDTPPEYPQQLASSCLPLR